jgi:ketosteroid isomerase-like protein
MQTDDRSSTQVEAVFEALSEALRARDAAAVGALFAPDARIFDLAPPLAHGFDGQGLADWLAGWDGPVEQSASDFEIKVSGDLAVCHGLVHVQTTRGGEEASWWMRATYALARDDRGWRIIHEHTSVPFYMDGSYRAAIDLAP